MEVCRPMKTVILYYTLGGATKSEAERLGAELGATVCRVFEKRKRSLLASFVPGVLQARKRTPVPIKPVEVNLAEYDRIIIGCPIWVSFPAPAFNSIVKLLPSGKPVDLFLCSGGGDSKESAQGTKELVEMRGCPVLSYRDVCTKKTPSRMKD